MKKFVLLTLALFYAFGISAQIGHSPNIDSDSTSSYITALLEDIDMKIHKVDANNRYKFYPTENMYNFLKLDTQTGRISSMVIGH